MAAWSTIKGIVLLESLSKLKGETVPDLTLSFSSSSSSEAKVRLGESNSLCAFFQSTFFILRQHE